MIGRNDSSTINSENVNCTENERYFEKMDHAYFHMIAINEANELFSNFNHVYAIGTILYKEYNKDEKSEVYRDYYSTMFAIQYFKEKREYDYIEEINKYISGILNMHNVVFDFNIQDLDRI